MLLSYGVPTCLSFFFFNDPATTEIYTLSLHDALPILDSLGRRGQLMAVLEKAIEGAQKTQRDRKSTRLNSSHTVISYAVFCLKKKKDVTKGKISPSRRLRDRENDYYKIQPTDNAPKNI